MIGLLLSVVLQTSGYGTQGEDYFQCWSNPEENRWIADCALGPYVGLVGEPVFTAFLTVPLLISLGIQSGSYKVPAILVMLLVGLVYSGMPPTVIMGLNALLVVATATSYYTLVKTRL